MTQDPADILARTILGEAAGEDALGQQAVLATIMNRVRDPRWPGDPIDVALQPQQFSAWNNGAGGNDLVSRGAGDPGYAEAYQLASQALAGDLEDPTNGATHYYSPMGMQALVDDGAQANAMPAWYDEIAAQGAPRTIGNHVFLGAVDGSVPYVMADGAANPTPEGVFDAAGADGILASPAAQVASAPGPSGFLPVDDGRSGAGRVYDWMGDQGFLSSLLTGAGLLIGGNEALPLLGDFGGQYDQHAQQAKLQRDLEQAMATLGGQLDPHSLAIVQSLAQAGQPDKALEYAMKALQGSDPEYAYEKQGDGTLVAINKRNPADIRKIGGPKPAADTGGGLPAAIKEADFIARSEGLEPGSVEHRARVGELAKSWRAGSDSGYDIVTNEDGSRSYVPKKPGSPALPVEGLPEPPAPTPSLKTVTDGTGQPIVWDENTGQEVGRLGSARPEDTPDPTTDQRHARQIALQRAAAAGHAPMSKEFGDFVKAEEARILATKYADPNAQKQDPEAITRHEQRFIDRYNKDPYVKDYNLMVSAYPALETAANLARQGNQQAAQAAVVSFVKTRDPTSVVRESETGAVVSSGGLPEDVLSQVNYILGGGQVSEQAIFNLVETVRADMAGRYPMASQAYTRAYNSALKRELEPDAFMMPPKRYGWMSQYDNEVRGPDPFPRDISKIPLPDLNDIARKQAADALRNLGSPQADQMGPFK